VLFAFARILSVLLVVVACGGKKSDEPDPLLVASESVTFESVAQLGPHRFESVLSWDRGEGRGGRTNEVMELLWGDWDNFQVRRLRDDRLAAEVRVVQGVAYTRSGKGRFREARDSELYRVQLAGTWSYWDRALEPFRGRLRSNYDQKEQVEGREARRFVIALTHPEEEPRTAHLPQSLVGQVLVDESTAVRLKAQVEGTYLESGDPDRPVIVSLKLHRADFGAFPDLAPPTRSRSPLFGERARPN